MKFLLLLVCTIFYVQAELSQEQVAKLKEYHTQCSQESSVDQDVLNKARQGEFADDEKLKNHVFCVLKKMGFLNDEGKIQLEVLKTKVGAALGDVEITNSLISECAKDQQTGPETAFQVVKCYFDKTPSHLSII